MILTDREIRNSLEHGLLEIEPRPREEAFASTSVDLTLARELRVFKDPKPGMITTIDPTMENFNSLEISKQLTEELIIGPNGYPLKQKNLVLGWTAERINLPLHGRLAARVEGKSSLARLGLAIHITAPTIHAGFKAPSIQLEIINHGPHTIKLSVGMPICQLIFEQTLGMPEKAYKGRFAGQSPTG